MNEAALHVCTSHREYLKVDARELGDWERRREARKRKLEIKLRLEKKRKKER